MSDKESNLQKDFWRGNFGKKYVSRHTTIEEKDSPYEKLTGITTETVFNRFFKGIDRKSRILEIGCNTGLSLSALQKMGFTNLHGLEINTYAYEIAKQKNPSMNFINSSIEDFDAEEKFDLVFTSWVLIHINPSKLNSVIKKILDLSRKYIFCFEYYSNELEEITYHGHSNTMWKQNFPLLFKELCPTIKTIKEEKIPYKIGNLQDVACLLIKNN